MKATVAAVAPRTTELLPSAVGMVPALAAVSFERPRPTRCRSSSTHPPSPSHNLRSSPPISGIQSTDHLLTFFLHRHRNIRTSAARPPPVAVYPGECSPSDLCPSPTRLWFAYLASAIECGPARSTVEIVSEFVAADAALCAQGARKVRDRPSQAGRAHQQRTRNPREGQASIHRRTVSINALIC